MQATVDHNSLDPHHASVQRQISLPTRKAVEIAYKSIRLRLTRSLLVTSGIVLALAFLMSILTTSAVVDSMRSWMQANLATSQSSTAQHLRHVLQQNGVATEAAEAQSDQTQKRWLVGIALLVAFVGILNAMLMSVTERFREIGTMKCLGALDSFIIKLFLIESLFQGLVGTVLGIVIGLSLGIGATIWNYHRWALRHIPWPSLALSAGVSLLVGVLITVAAAVYPAWQAARMQPIDAMRTET